MIFDKTNRGYIVKSECGRFSFELADRPELIGEDIEKRGKTTLYTCIYNAGGIKFTITHKVVQRKSCYEFYEKVKFMTCEEGHKHDLFE